MNRMSYVTTWGPYQAIGLIDEHEILAVVIYNDFYATGCAIHIAALPGRRWLTKQFLFAAFDYPFRQLGYKRLTGYVASRNLEAQRLDEHLGFKREGYLREMLPDDDVIVFGMLRSECRWLEVPSGRKIAGSGRTRSVSISGCADGSESAERGVCGGAEPHEHVHADGKPDLH